MLELTLAVYSEATIRAWHNLHAKRPRASVPMSAIAGYVAAGHVADLCNAGVFPLELFPGSGKLQPGQYVSTTELKDAGVRRLLIRWDNNRKVNVLHLA